VLVFSLYSNVGVDNLLNFDISLQLYPNPNNGTFTIEIDDRARLNLQLPIFNTLGEEVYYDRFYSSGNTSKLLNLSHFGNGVYFVHLYANDNLAYRAKVIIQK
jgi:hypothetical protein